MNIIAHISLVGWVPALLLLFAALPPRRAVVVAFIAAWLFLPVAGYTIPGFPDYTKMSATTVGALMGMVLFDFDRLRALRPQWADLPMFIWCLCPLASSMTNDLGVYDGLSASLSQTVTWGLPYLIGRAYFSDFEGLCDLARGIVIGGLLYVPLCLWETRMSPQLHRFIYGFSVAPNFGLVIRYGGYRPLVFMQTGLEVGMWMTAASLVAFWLWSCGVLKPLWSVSFTWLLPVLIITTIFCKSTGSLSLLALGIAIFYALKLSKSSIPVLALVVAAPLYMGARATGLWSGESIVESICSVLPEDRAGSIQCRLDNENMLVAKALMRPVFGWGAWGRARVYDEHGKDISITDGFWVIALGNHGLVGLASITTALLLPLVLLLKRYSVRLWLDPAVAPAAVLAVLLGLYMIDNLSNAMLNPIYMLAIGGLTALTTQIPGRTDPRREVVQDCYDRATQLVEEGRTEEAEKTHLQALDLYESMAAEFPGDPEGREGLVHCYTNLGRFLKNRGRPQEAEEAWRRALDLWSELAADFPERPEYQGQWLNGHNDLAWLLTTCPDPAARNAARAVQLAQKAVELAPGCRTYWNTLGAASYRAGDWEAAITALERSVALSWGGTSFDHFFLAMAYWQRGDKEQARIWYDRANDWMEKHRPSDIELLRFRTEAADLLTPVPSDLSNSAFP